MRYYRFLLRYFPISLFTLWALKLLIVSPTLSEVGAFAVVAAIAGLFHYKRAIDINEAHNARLIKLELTQNILKDDLSSAKVSMGFKRRE